MPSIGIHGGPEDGLDVEVTSLPNEGQQTMANSISVAIASNQSAVSVTGPVTDTELRATPVVISGAVITI